MRRPGDGSAKTLDSELWHLWRAHITGCNIQRRCSSPHVKLSGCWVVWVRDAAVERGVLAASVKLLFYLVFAGRTLSLPAYVCQTCIISKHNRLEARGARYSTPPSAFTLRRRLTRMCSVIAPLDHGERRAQGSRRDAAGKSQCAGNDCQAQTEALSPAPQTR